MANPINPNSMKQDNLEISWVEELAGEFFFFCQIEKSGKKFEMVLSLEEVRSFVSTHEELKPGILNRIKELGFEFPSKQNFGSISQKNVSARKIMKDITNSFKNGIKQASAFSDLSKPNPGTKEQLKLNQPLKKEELRQYQNLLKNWQKSKTDYYETLYKNYSLSFDQSFNFLNSIPEWKCWKSRDRSVDRIARCKKSEDWEKLGKRSKRRKVVIGRDEGKLGKKKIKICQDANQVEENEFVKKDQSEEVWVWTRARTRSILRGSSRVKQYSTP